MDGARRSHAMQRCTRRPGRSSLALPRRNQRKGSATTGRTTPRHSRRAHRVVVVVPCGLAGRTSLLVTTLGDRVMVAMNMFCRLTLLLCSSSIGRQRLTHAVLLRAPLFIDSLHTVDTHTHTRTQYNGLYMDGGARQRQGRAGRSSRRHCPILFASWCSEAVLLELERVLCSAGFSLRNSAASAGPALHCTSAGGRPTSLARTY